MHADGCCAFYNFQLFSEPRAGRPANTFATFLLSRNLVTSKLYFLTGCQSCGSHYGPFGAPHGGPRDKRR